MATNLKQLITIIGTTGVGKSQLSIELAKALNGEIINGDSMQMYRGVDNITNKHPIPERENIPHHLLGHVNWNEEYSVKQFENEAISIIDDKHSRGKIPILIGGTHYYIQSILFKNSTIAASDIKSTPLTPKQSEILDDPNLVWDQLTQLDPVISQKFHPNDTRRLRRALEIYFTTNKKPSDIYEQQQNDLLSLRYKSLVFWIWSDQQALDPRLDKRVDQMVANGLYNEVDELYREYKKSGSTSDRGIYQVIGFRQFLPWLEKQDSTPDNGIEQMKQVTRKYAKTQTKWIKKKLLFMMNQVAGLGDVALLDATDLTKWDENVNKRGVSIAKDFLNSTSYIEPLAPEGLEDMLKVRDEKEAFNKDKWKHFECDVCNLTFVGQDAWDIHIKGRKHRAVLRKQGRAERNEQFKRQKLQNDEEPQSSRPPTEIQTETQIQDKD